MLGKELFQVQDRSTVTEPGLLYYIEGMLITVLSNVCTSLSLANRVKYQVVSIILDDNDMFNFP